MAEDHRYAGSVGFEMGIQYLISPDFTLGAHVQNPYQTGFHTLSGDYQYPCIIGFGVAYQFSETFLVSSEVEYDFSSYLIFKTGMEYAWLEKFFIRGGFSLKPYLLTFGFGFKLNKVSIDLSGSYHQYLGYSPAVSFQYRF